MKKKGLGGVDRQLVFTFHPQEQMLWRQNKRLGLMFASS